MSFFQSIPALNELSKSIALRKKEKLQYFESFCSFGLYRVEPPAVYPRGYSVQKAMLLWRKSNELSENFSFDTEFNLVF